MTPLAASHHDLPPLEVHVVHRHRKVFEQAQAAAVEDLPEEPERRLDFVEERVDGAARAYRRQVVRVPGALQSLQGGHLQLDFVEGRSHAQEARGRDIASGAERPDTRNREIVSRPNNRNSGIGSLWHLSATSG